MEQSQYYQYYNNEMETDEEIQQQQEQEQEQEPRTREYDYEEDAYSIGEIELTSEDEEETDNLADLQNLHEEATDMMRNNIQPTEGWYDDRYKYIYKYSHLNWDEMATKFKDKDNIMYHLCTTTKMYIRDILDGYSGTPNFDFSLYYTILSNIIHLWNYYSNKYVGDETDIDVIKLIESMSFL